MDSILIVGVETVVGANLAATLADEAEVVGLSLAPGVELAGVDVRMLGATDDETARRAIAAASAQRVVYCGAAARSCWESPDATFADDAVASIEPWARAACEANVPLTVFSSDAVFTGPWMFHRENSTSLCPSREAEALRAMEIRAMELCPTALVVRTNAYGWSPLGATGWIETALGSLAARTAASLDCLRHATPILATDLAALVRDCWSQSLAGVYHIAGSERANPARFMEQMAETFELPVPLRCRLEPLETRPEGFGRGETSLHTKKIRKTLEIALPTLSEGIERLHVQRLTGYAERVCPVRCPEPARSRVA